MHLGPACITGPLTDFVLPILPVNSYLVFLLHALLKSYYIGLPTRSFISFATTSSTSLHDLQAAFSIALARHCEFVTMDSASSPNSGIRLVHSSRVTVWSFSSFVSSYTALRSLLFECFYRTWTRFSPRPCFFFLFIFLEQFDQVLFVCLQTWTFTDPVRCPKSNAYTWYFLGLARHRVLVI